MPESKGLKRTALAALIPGAKFDPKTFEVSAVSDPEAPTIVFNLRGTIFETYRSNLYKRNLSNLSKEEFLGQFYRETLNDYFFDRDPSLFSSVLEYQRTGVLHIPVNICGKVARQELEFWGIDESRIEKCCWSTFDSWNSTYDALKELEETQNRIFDRYTEEKLADMKYGRIRATIWNFLSNPKSSHGAKIYGMITVAFIILSVISFLVITHPSGRVGMFRDWGESLHKNISKYEIISSSVPHPSLIIIDSICLAFFSCEFIIRFFTCPNWKLFISNAMNIVDIVSVVADHINIIMRYTVKDIRISAYVNLFGLFRTLRIFRLVRYIPGLWIMLYTLKATFWDLLFMMCFMSVCMIMFSTMIYHVENDKFPNIPIGLWWALITMTTVGYGDMFPTTFVGYLVGSACAITGLLMVGFTIPIISNHFVMYFSYYAHMRYMQEAQWCEENKHMEEMTKLKNTTKDDKPEIECESEVEKKRVAVNSSKDRSTISNLCGFPCCLPRLRSKSNRKWEN